MVILVEHDHVAAAHHCAEDAQVGLHAGGEDQRGLLADEFGQFVFQLLVQLERPVEEA